MGQFEKIDPQGLKAPVISKDLMYGLKPVPFKLTHHPTLLVGKIRGLDASGTF
jgi:hypothetical protein